MSAIYPIIDVLALAAVAVGLGLWGLRLEWREYRRVSRMAEDMRGRE